MVNVNFRYIYHTWMVREQLFRVPGCFFYDESFLSKRSCQQPVATCRIKSARFRTDLLVGSKHSFERTICDRSIWGQKMFTLFSRSISSLKKTTCRCDTMLCPAGFDFPTKTSRVLHFLDSSAVCGVFVFEHIYMNVWWYCWKKSGYPSIMYETLWKMGNSPYQLMQDVFHQYVICVMFYQLQLFAAVVPRYHWVSIRMWDAPALQQSRITWQYSLASGIMMCLYKEFFRILKNRPFIPQQPL